MDGVDSMVSNEDPNQKPSGERSSDAGPEGDPFPDPLQAASQGMQTVSNDAVAGETVYPGRGEGNNGPTGGAEREVEPVYDEHGNDKNNGSPVENGTNSELDDR
jgi:hypothetical protein